MLALTELLKEKGWFKATSKSSVLRREPACAWFSAGAHDKCQSNKYLPALQNTVLRNAFKQWLVVHFYLPVAGHNKANEHVNLMEMFVTFVWGYYSQNQHPKIPALTDVGRLTFTYIWRMQHSLFR